MTYEYWATGARSRGTKAPAIPILPHFNFLTVYIFLGSFNTEFANVLFQSQLNLVFKRTDKPAGGKKVLAERSCGFIWWRIFQGTDIPQPWLKSNFSQEPQRACILYV